MAINSWLRTSSSFAWATAFSAAAGVPGFRRGRAALALAAALAGGGGAAAAPELRAPAPEFSLPGLSGEELRLKDLRGRVVILDFWAPWCPACRESLAFLEGLRKRWEVRGVEIVSVSEEEDRDAVLSYVRGRGLGQRVLLDRRGRALSRFHVRAFPAMFLIDAEGRMRARWFGLDDGGKEELERALASLAPYKEPEKKKE